MRNKTTNEIKDIIYNQNPNIDFISSKVIKQNNKYKRLVYMRCICGNIFCKTLDHIQNDKYLLCKTCAKENIRKKRKKTYNDRYRLDIENHGFELLDKHCDLYANQSVRVKELKTGYIGYIYPNKIPKNLIVFGLSYNYDNLLYNINRYAYNQGLKTRAVSISKQQNKKELCIDFVCECNAVFTTTYRAFLKGSKIVCDDCSNIISNNELSVKNFLDKSNIQYIYQFTEEKLRDVLPLSFDFYLCKYNLFIEIQGEHHYMPVNFGGNLTDAELQKRFDRYVYHDKLKKQYCEQKHISLLILSYKDIKNNSFQNKILEFIQTTQI